MKAYGGPLYVSFAAGTTGSWLIDRITSVTGEGLPAATHLEVIEGELAYSCSDTWMLRGVVSNSRYTNRDEMKALTASQETLNRKKATRAALIPIKKTGAWWALAQDERRAVFEAQSHHIAIGLKYLPAIARRLHHCRDLDEPFDFLTWFEYAPEDSSSFEDLVAALRSTPEWQFVEREIDIRLTRVDAEQ